MDSKRQRRLAYEVLDKDPVKEDIRRFFQRVKEKLTDRGLKVLGITTDGSQLYPDPIAEIFPGANHQSCEFHVIKEITRDVLRALSRLRKSLAAKIPSLPRGRPGTAAQKAKVKLAKRIRQRITDLFDHRYLLVQHGLASSEEKILRRLSRPYPEVRDLRELMNEVYRLFDRRCRMDTAQAKLAKLRRKLGRFKHLGKVLSKIKSPNLEKALTFLDDKELESTSNSVERANRRHRKMQKSIYRVRTKESLISRIACDMMRDKELGSQNTFVRLLHASRGHQPPEQRL